MLLNFWVKLKYYYLVTSMLDYIIYISGRYLKLLFNNNRRSESEVICDILKSAQEDVKKTRLMYQANMPYTQFSKYLDVLIEKDLLGIKDTNPSGQIYYTTEKGNELLKSIEIVLGALK